MAPASKRIEILLVNNLTGPLRALAAIGTGDVRLHEWRFDAISAEADPSAYDGIIPSGTDISPAVSPSVYEAEMRLVRRARCPVLGICGGHHIVTLAWGGALKEVERPVYGRTRVLRTKSDVLFDGLKETFTVFSKHRWCVSRAPAGFDVIARHEPLGLIYGIRKNGDMVFGVQFHPERRNDGTAILTNFMILVRKHRYVSGRE